MTYSRKEPVFGILVICVTCVLFVFCLAAFKIIHELQASIVVFWAIVYTTALCIPSLIYSTIVIAYYPQVSRQGICHIINFVLSVAWMIAAAVQLVDPNNIIAGRPHGESNRGFRARIILSGTAAGLWLVLALWGGLGILGVIPQEPEVRRNASSGDEEMM